jgi:hypothetical protein
VFPRCPKRPTLPKILLTCDQVNCQRCGADLSDDPLWTSITIQCPECGQPAPALPELESQEERVAALSRRAIAELIIFLTTAAVVTGACWAVFRLIDAIPQWRSRLTHTGIYSVTRRDGPDYYLRSVSLPAAGPQRPLALDALLTYPIREPRDVVRIFDAATLRQGAVCPRVELPAFSDALRRTTGCLIAGVTDTRQTPYSLWLLDFARSANRVLRTLRDEVRVPPPTGYAVVRVFEAGDPIPAPLLEFHERSPEIAGAAFGGPYIAIFAADTAPDTALPHELVHAYLGIAMGHARERIPAWFHEGVALNLARTPLITASDRGNDLRFSSLTAQYQEYKRVFDRVETRLGRERYLATIRDCVAQGSERPLLAATGSQDYAALRQFTDAWVFADVRPYLLMLLAGLAAASANLIRRRRRMQTDVQPEVQSLHELPPRHSGPGHDSDPL